MEAVQATVEALLPGYAAMVGRFIVEDPLEQARKALDFARIRADSRRKRLTLAAQEGLEAEASLASDVLEIMLVPSLPPYTGQYRLVPNGLWCLSKSTALRPQNEGRQTDRPAGNPRYR